MNSRNQILDLFKGIAIMAVILYHAGLLIYGYLGVEMFLVIGGYLITKSILHTYEKGRFSYWDYLCKRLVRLWPLALLITILSLAGGYFTMLPDAFKNTCETAVGTSTFTNNFIQYITAGDYWDTANEYKPLMHTWYLGVIFQFYVLYPLIFMLSHRFAKDYVKASRTTLMLVFASSLLFFILPGTDTAVTFYLLPARLYEFAAGGIIALSTQVPQGTRNNQTVMTTFLFFAIVLLCINDAYNMAKVRLLLTVALSVLIILYSEKSSFSTSASLGHKILSVFVPLGIASYSLYLWHQVIFAFYRYVINSGLTLWSYMLTIGLSLVVGYLSYLWIEKGITSFTKNNKPHTYFVLALCLLVTGSIIAFSVKYYKTQGVVRDIPELEVYVNDPSSWSPQEYNSRITTLYEKPFPPRNGNKNILVVGDSYARDWINIMLESHIDSVNIIYSKDIAYNLKEKIAEADIIFLANCGTADTYVDYLPQMMKKKFFRVGYKFFGRVIPVVYNHSHTSDYYKQTVYQDCPINNAESIEFKGMYVNIMDSISNPDGTVNIFTPEKKLISHDGLHLTEAGAKRFSELINVKHLLKQ